MRRSIARPALGVVACALLLSGCASTPVDEVRISVKRIALSLAFEDEALLKPVEPETIIRYLPAPEQFEVEDLATFRTPPRLPEVEREPPLCPAVDPGTPLEEAVAVTISEPPKPGWYRRHNKGKIGITGGALPITFPLPRVTLMEIKDVHTVERPDSPAAARPLGDVGGSEAPAAAEAIAGMVPVMRFTAAHEIGTLTVTDIYEYDDASLRLVQRTTKTTAGTTVFNPQPQVALVELGNFGNDWKEAGQDRVSRTAMVVQGKVVGQEPVDVCGSLVDTLKYANDEQTVNLETAEQSGTQGPANVYNIAPQKNGMIVREEKHFSQVVSFAGAKLVLDWDYTSTLGNFEPYPTKLDAIKAIAAAEAAR